MKKIAPIALVALMALAFTSCKKDYKCKCTTTSNGASATTYSESFKETKKKAKDKCNALDGETTNSGITVKVDCEVE